MIAFRFAALTVMLAALLLQTGCSLIGSGASPAAGGWAADDDPAGQPREVSPGRWQTWSDAFTRQYRQAVEGIRSDLAILDSDDDGLDHFGPVVAREMRSARAELALPPR